MRHHKDNGLCSANSGSPFLRHMPALASSAAITPPAAPTPTMTTSVFTVAIGAPADSASES
jgi:hypothetical protein